MLYILFGQDDFSIHESLEEIKIGLGDPGLLATNTSILDGRQVTPEQLKSVCDTVPFLTEKRLVIVQGLLERFEAESRSGSRQRGKNATAERQNEVKLFSTSLSQVPESTVVILTSEKVGGNNPLLKEASAYAQVKNFPMLRDARLHQWIQKRVAQEGGSIAPPGVSLLAGLAGNDLWIMANEIRKLVLYASGARIEEKDIKTVVSYAQETTVFNLIDAIFELKPGLAEQTLHKLLEEGAAPAYLMTMLSRQLHMITLAKELKKNKKSETEIRDKLGLSSSFALRKVLEHVDRYSMARLKDVYHKLLEADISIKTGKFSGELALSLLVAELCQSRGFN